MLLNENKSVPKTVTFQQALKCIIEYFQHDKDKALQFYMRKNPEFGGVSPFEMVKQGKGRKLIKMIDKCTVNL